MQTLVVGFVGLGVMGAPMARHLAHAGHRLRLHDADMAVARSLAQTPGVAARACDTPAALAEGCDIVVTMLPDGEVVQRVALGEQGLIHGLRAGALLLDTSSSEPWLTRQTAAALSGRGVAMVDAPVSGAQWGAEAAQLVFMVGGNEADLQRVHPLLDGMGRAVFHVGPLGAGHTMKCINNLITAVTFAATMEGLVLGKRVGLDPAAMVEVLDESTGGSWITKNHIRQRVLSRSFDDPFKLELMLKDIGIALGLGHEAQLPMPLSALNQQLWRAAVLSAGPSASVSELARWVEQQAGTAVTPGAEARAQARARPDILLRNS